ncbi:helix-turn-helix transcriptional regulator [Cupriavidus pauculus]|uniref:HTH luxR-type domain-containing protein n=1 Tax=Cupriavidus pauculus TaxID=82633 RepID=A0A2N5C6N4_9BURK|nr:LuxR C-terminal-related transcriptional regulator [Cupriavidus pauculus]PLP97889.1 hypothetical protein CYJ10_24055 [Cupriavidus pauculus]
MTATDQLFQVIQLTYRAVLCEDAWDVPLEAFSRLVKAERSMIALGDVSGGTILAAYGMSVHACQQIRQQLATACPAWIATIPVGVPTPQTSRISDSEFAKSDLYQKAVRPVDGFYGMVTPLFRVRRRSALFVAGRVRGDRDFQRDDVATAATFVPHLQTALDLRARIAATEQRVAVSERLVPDRGVGLIWLDEDLRPIHADATALKLAGKYLTIQPAGISAAVPQDGQTLFATIARAAILSHSRGRRGAPIAIDGSLCCHLSREWPLPPLSITVVPLDPDVPWMMDAARLVMVLTEEGGKPLAAGAAERLSELTPRERDLVAQLLEGRSLDEAGRHLNISKETARTYLRRVFAKTDTHRQGELIALLRKSGY